MSEKKPRQAKQAKSKKIPKYVTKEEFIAKIMASIEQFQDIINELKEEEKKIESLNLKKVPMLLKETIEDMEYDLEEAKEKLEDVKNMEEKPLSEVVIKPAE